MIRVVVNGAQGKMGREIVKFTEDSADLELAGTVEVDDSLDAILSQVKPDIVIDFTTPETRMEIIQTCVAHDVNIVVGTTGFTDNDLVQIKELLASKKCGVFIAPNFNIGNVLMQQFAYKAAKYYDATEIIEYHHNQKADYPSGTAFKTAQGLAQVRRDWNQKTNDKVANIEGARGGDYQGIKVHAVRMPGFIAHQEVIFGQ
jgi:4-hydroxy-tetrahydrodipicolinate reductase